MAKHVSKSDTPEIFLQSFHIEKGTETVPSILRLVHPHPAKQNSESYKQVCLHFKEAILLRENIQKLPVDSNRMW